ncbi:MAG: hypothetical protein ACREN7_05600 [Candidatus Dormibacteria bacterium]
MERSQALAVVTVNLRIRGVGRDGRGQAATPSTLESTGFSVAYGDVTPPPP